MSYRKQIELELKVAVPHWATLKARLDKDFVFKGAFIRKDTYFRCLLSSQELRVREECPAGETMAKHYTLTFKQRDFQYTEINQEQEYFWQDSQALEEFLSQRYPQKEVVFYKEKSVRVYSCAMPWTLELCRVKHLGDFLELETLLPVGIDADRIKKEQKLLFKQLAELGFCETTIEKRSYRELFLAQKGLPLSVFYRK